MVGTQDVSTKDCLRRCDANGGEGTVTVRDAEHGLQAGQARGWKHETFSPNARLKPGLPSPSNVNGILPYTAQPYS